MNSILRSSAIRLILLFLFQWYSPNSFSQTRISDSLQLVLSKAKSDSAREDVAEAYFNLGRVKANEGALQEALSFYHLSADIFMQTKNEKDVGAVFNSAGEACRNYGEYEKAFDYYRKSFDIAVKNKDLNSQAIVLGNKGITYILKGDMLSALDCFEQSLKINLRTGNKSRTAETLSNIGYIYQSQKDLDKALEYYLKSLKIEEETKNKDGISISYNNIGSIYREKGDAETALMYFEKSLKIQKETNDQFSIGSTYNNIGIAYRMKNDYDNAMEYFKIALEEASRSGDKVAHVHSIMSIGDLYQRKGDFKNAVFYLNQSLKMAEEIGYPLAIRESSLRLYQIYKKMNRKGEALGFYEKYILMKDSIYNEETKNASIKSQFKYEYEKKLVADSTKAAGEKKITQAKLAESDAKLKQERIQRFALYGGLALVLTFAAFMLDRFRVTNKQKKVIEAKEQETQKQNLIITHQKHLVEEKQKEIVDSINYAKRIQFTLLAHDEFLKENLSDFFVLFHPKDIVSGDFYWAAKVNNSSNESLFYLAVCDSTGHGVPGAFMSLLNMGFLTEAIKEKDIFEPNKILDFVRQRLIDNISREGQKDGFDGILICINQSTKVITYAAANNAPVIIRNGVYEELEADRMPVGMGERKENFSLHSIEYTQGDTLYLYTDGYADQFGGPKGKKFKYRPLNEMLQELSGNNSASQKEHLRKVFNEWRGELEQVDDVSVVGIRL